MIQSMTAFASRSGSHDGASWAWEMRGVNGRGLDLRLRLPDAIEGLEAGVRAALSAALSRGNVSVSLRLVRADTAAELVLDESQLDRVLTALNQVQERAFALGVTLGQPTAADVLTQRGVIVPGTGTDDDTAALAKVLLADFADILSEFSDMRMREGTAIEAILTDQLDRIASITDEAAAAAEARQPEAHAAITAALRRVFEEVPEVEEARLSQELALIAIKADVTEEIDRLRTHVAAARDLIADDKPAGRRLDFLAQEFNREANTLCSKAANSALTRIGLELKAVIDQMREQIQNVE